MSIRYVLILILFTLLLAACGASVDSAPATQTDATSSEPTIEDSPLSPPATPSLDRSEDPQDPMTTPTGATAQAVATAKERLASELDVSAEAIELASVEPVEWSDGSLGCPQPGQNYAQVITPGYRIELRLEGRVYEVHTDRGGRAAAICGQRQERGPEAAVAHLAEQLDVSQNEIETLSVERVEWPDASLGCPEPGKMYAQVITPGYQVVLEVEGEEFEVHTDLKGRNAVICESDR